MNLQKNPSQLFLSLFFLIVAITSSAQSNAVSAGGDASGSTGSISYSVGQVDYVTANGIGGTATQGLQQPYEIVVISSVESSTVAIDLKAFPNPTADILNLSIDKKDARVISYQLLDASSKLVIQAQATENITNVPIQELANGIYYLSVFEPNSANPLKTFKIIKNK